MIGEKSFVGPCDSHKRKKFVKMKIVVVTVEKNVEDHVSNIMEDMLETELWYRKLEVCYRESCHMCNDLNVEEISYEVFNIRSKQRCHTRWFNILLILLIYYKWIL